MDGIYFTEDHEWVQVSGSEATLGISEYATEELGEIVYLELPSVGDNLSKSSTFGAVESTKSVSDLYTPIDCQVVEVNSSAENSPEVINQSPYKEGWLIKVKATNTNDYDDLLSPEDYESLINEE